MEGTNSASGDGDKRDVAPPSRLSLRVKAACFRSLLYVSGTVSSLSPHRPPSPAFVRTIPSTLSSSFKGGNITLQFYVPDGYNDPQRRRQPYPAVVNFHGGGFAVGTATDDGRFARHVIDTAGAVFVSVAYRLAPEHPFPTAVEDATDAILYVIQEAAALRIDSQRLATLGFSSGGNLALTSLLRLGQHAEEQRQKGTPVPEHRFVAAAPWYPITEYSVSRAARRAACVRPDLTLPPAITNFFDHSYLDRLTGGHDLRDPCLSPSQAPDARLARDIPPHVIMYTCEHDLLQREGESLAARLAQAPISKDVYHKMVPGVTHAWDKTSSLFGLSAGVEELYVECCQKLKAAFDPAE